MIKKLAMTLALLCGLSMSQGGSAAPLYSLTVLDRLDGRPSFAQDINLSGQVVGYAVTQAGTYIAVLWQDGQVVNLHQWSAGVATGNGKAYAINDRGEIAGSANVRGRVHATVWANGGATDLDPLSATSAAFDIDRDGNVVGRSGSEAALFAGGVVTKLADGRSSNVLGIAPTSGRVVGNALDQFERASTFAGGSFSYLESSSIASTAKAVNDSGRIVGEGVNCQSGQLTRCALSWSGADAVVLDTLGGASALANDINAGGQIVGASDTAGNQQHAVIWTAGVVADLNLLITNVDDWLVYDALAINDVGQIVGHAYNLSSRETRSVVLTPLTVSEPTTLWLVLAGLLAITRAAPVSSRRPSSRKWPPAAVRAMQRWRMRA